MAGGACVAGGMHGRRGRWGDMHGRGDVVGGIYGRWGGACVAGGGMCGRGHAWWGCAWQGGMRCRWGVCVAGGVHSMGGMHATPSPPADTTGYGQRAGGTHPTGMHSSF